MRSEIEKFIAKQFVAAITKIIRDNPADSPKELAGRIFEAIKQRYEVRRLVKGKLKKPTVGNNRQV